MSESSDDKYCFLDDLIIKDYFTNREYMKIIIEDEPTYPVSSVIEFQSSMNELIDQKVKELTDYCQVIVSNLLNKMVPYNCPKELRMYFHKLKFLSFLYNKVLVKKNKYLISNVTLLKKDILSLVHLCSIFPFVEKKISFKPKYSPEAIFAELRKITDNKYSQMTAEYSTKIIPALNLYTQESPNITTPTFEYSSPINEETSFAFYCFVNSNEFPLKDEIDLFLSEIKEESFLSDISELASNIVEIMNYKQSAFKFITQHLVKYAFDESDFFYKPLLENSSFLDEVDIVKSISGFEIPDYLYKNISPDASLDEFFKENPILNEAASDFFQVIFEPTPIDVLIRIDNVIKKINTYITNIIKKEGETIAFIPFDDTFVLFCAVVAVADIPNFDAISKFVTVFLNEKFLVNELSFAQSELNCAEEWRNSLIRAKKNQNI